MTNFYFCNDPKCEDFASHCRLLVARRPDISSLCKTRAQQLLRWATIYPQ